MLQQELLNILAALEDLIFISEPEDLLSPRLPTTSLTQRTPSRGTHHHFMIVLCQTILPVDLRLLFLEHGTYGVVDENFFVLFMFIHQTTHKGKVFIIETLAESRKLASNCLLLCLISRAIHQNEFRAELDFFKFFGKVRGRHEETFLVKASE